VQQHKDVLNFKKKTKSKHHSIQPKSIRSKNQDKPTNLQGQAETSVSKTNPNPTLSSSSAQKHSTKDSKKEQNTSSRIYSKRRKADSRDSNLASPMDADHLLSSLYSINPFSFAF
jgi:hypothetical protein